MSALVLHKGVCSLHAGELPDVRGDGGGAGRGGTHDEGDDEGRGAGDAALAAGGGERGRGGGGEGTHWMRTPWLRCRAASTKAMAVGKPSETRSRWPWDQLSLR